MLTVCAIRTCRASMVFDAIPKDSCSPDFARTQRVDSLSSPKAIGADTDGKVSKSTLMRYMDALRRVNVVDDIPAWYPALRSPVRLRQAPKRHLSDPSLAASLLGLIRRL